jgi:hypothetical protein
MKSLKALAFFIVVIVSSFPVNARVRTKLTERDFDQQMKKSHIMVVLFYEGEKGGNRKDNKHDKDSSTLRLYELVSSKKQYDDADVVFIKINLAMNQSHPIAQRYGIGQLPACIILEDGRPCLNADGTIAMLTHFSEKQHLYTFIDRCFGKSIDNAIAQKEQRTEDRLKESYDEAAPYFYPATVYTVPGDNSTWLKPTRNFRSN